MNVCCVSNQYTGFCQYLTSAAKPSRDTPREAHSHTIWLYHTLSVPAVRYASVYIFICFSSVDPSFFFFQVYSVGLFSTFFCFFCSALSSASVSVTFLVSGRSIVWPRLGSLGNHLKCDSQPIHQLAVPLPSHTARNGEIADKSQLLVNHGIIPFSVRTFKKKKPTVVRLVSYRRTKGRFKDLHHRGSRG